LNSINDNVVKLRKSLFQNLKNRALDYESHLNADLSNYQKDQDKIAKRPYQESNNNELIQSILDSNIIFLGDFHTFDQNARSVIRIFRQLLRRNKEIAIALEMVEAKKQYAIDAYINHHITEFEFLDEINYRESWRFPWIHYKQIFDIAKEYNIPIYGLNISDKSLQERDEFAAEVLGKISQVLPKAKILTVYGELHIVPNKIPKSLKDINPMLKSTIIHQNLDGIYWKQIKEKTNYKIIKFKNSEFCIQSAPPWVKYESMLYWYDNLVNDPDFDLHEYIIENGKKIFGDDAHENFFQLTSEVLGLINFPINEERLETFNLYDHTSLEYLSDYLTENFDPKLNRYYNKLISNNYSFKFCGDDTIYCSSYSLNRLSYLAGIFLYQIKLEEKSYSLQKLLLKGNSSEKCIYMIFESMFAHFFSKVFNPHRKCDLYQDLLLKSKVTSHLKESLTILDQEDFSSVKRKQLYHIFLTSYPVGHLLGEHLYEALFNQHQASEKIEISKLHEIIEMTPTAESYSAIRSMLLSSKQYKTRRKGIY
jgi:uncharacterized iron-regulated protein